jgi:hypothetical protein
MDGIAVFQRKMFDEARNKTQHLWSQIDHRQRPPKRLAGESEGGLAQRAVSFACREGPVYLSKVSAELSKRR